MMSQRGRGFGKTPLGHHRDTPNMAQGPPEGGVQPEGQSQVGVELGNAQKSVERGKNEVRGKRTL